MKSIAKEILFSLFFLLVPVFSFAQQLPDTAFTYSIIHTAYEKGEGPVVYIDAAHNNFHTKDGGFFAFGKLLEQDGYNVKSLNTPISDAGVLKDCKILVIANAMNIANADDWANPTLSAFSEDEINVIKTFVKNGGSLFLIADHMPFAGAAYELGKAFGFEFLNGFAYTGERTWPPSVFNFENNTLEKTSVVTGTKDYEMINQIATFTGSAFKIPEVAVPVLSFLKEHYALLPDTAWQFNENTPRQNLEGYYQGALMKFGKGRVAVFGEAAMFTAQVVNGTRKVGFNSESAPKNAQFTLNLIHWLDSLLN
jgi:hypothetical protein